MRKNVLFACSVVLVANGVHSILFPPENRVKYWVDLAGIPIGLAIICRHQND